MTDHKILWSIAETAQYLGVSRRTVERWMAAGRLPVVKMSRRLVKIPVVSVNTFITRQTQCLIPLPKPLESSPCAAQQLAEILRFPRRQARR